MSSTDLSRKDFDVQPVAWLRGRENAALRQMLELTARPGILSLALGLPDPALFPIPELRETTGRLLDCDPLALQLRETRSALKRQITDLMAERGAPCRPEQVFLTSGAQQAVNLLTRLLLAPGDVVVSEELTYTFIRRMSDAVGARLETVPTHFETGIDLEALEAALSRSPRPKLVYLIGDGHNPLGYSLDGDARRQLVELAGHYGVPLVEDDPYGLLHYADAPRPPLKALDPDWVFYAGTFSKILAPALRVGWLVMSEALVPQLGVLKDLTDIDASTFAQGVVSTYLGEGHLPDHLLRLRRHYGERRDRLVSSLSKHLPEVSFTVPSSGLFLWARLPQQIDAEALLEKAVHEEQVAFLPGSAFRVGPGTAGRNAMRLNFSILPPEQLEEAVRRLARALRSLT